MCAAPDRHLVLHAPQPGVRLLDPRTRCFSDLPAWLERHRAALANKRIFMYCTGACGRGRALWARPRNSPRKALPAGQVAAARARLCARAGGVRCERASAYVREMGPQFQDVYQLHGAPSCIAPRCPTSLCHRRRHTSFAPIAHSIQVVPALCRTGTPSAGGIQRYLEAFPDGGLFRGKVKGGAAWPASP